MKSCLLTLLLDFVVGYFLLIGLIFSLPQIIHRSGVSWQVTSTETAKLIESINPLTETIAKNQTPINQKTSLNATDAAHNALLLFTYETIILSVVIIFIPLMIITWLQGSIDLDGTIIGLFGVSTIVGLFGGIFIPLYVWQQFNDEIGTPAYHLFWPVIGGVAVVMGYAMPFICLGIAHAIVSQCLSFIYRLIGLVFTVTTKSQWSFLISMIVLVLMAFLMVWLGNELEFPLNINFPYLNNLGSEVTSCTTSIKIGEIVKGTLPNSKPQDVYCLASQAGQWVSIRMFFPKDSDITLNPYLELQKPDGTVLAHNDDGVGIGDNSFFTVQLSENGTYRLIATRSAGFGDYRLLVEAVHKAAAGDVNNDCVVNKTDEQLLLESLGYNSYNFDLDVDLSGVVHTRDVIFLQRAVGQTCN